MAEGIMLIMVIIWTIVLLIAYHTIFEVFYFSLFDGIFKELLAAFLIAVALTMLTISLWWLIVIVSMTVGIIAMKKTGESSVLIGAIVISVLFTFLGIKVKQEDSYALNIPQTQIEQKFNA